MRRITVERYDDAKPAGYSGLIEGMRDDGTTWIMWLDSEGDPLLYFAHRDESGAVIGDPILLSRDRKKRSGEVPYQSS